MSYCRFSTEAFRSEVYVYDDVMGGTTVHVASSRRIGEFPKIPSLSDGLRPEEFVDAYRKAFADVQKLPREEIKSSFAGTSHYFDGPCQARNFLIFLKEEEGFYTPQDCLDALEEACKEEQEEEA